MDEQLRKAVEAAAQREEVRQAVAEIYRDVERNIAQRRPVCIMSGRCCRFEEFGHRLYVTTAELATFARQLTTPADPDWDGRGCPFQKGKLCTVHSIRPFGCRIFFCDSTAQEWQEEQYHQFHTRLKRLHEDLDIPYFYLEWRRALEILRLSGERALGQ